MKRAARLTSALLARKGFALPAASTAHLEHMTAAISGNMGDISAQIPELVSGAQLPEPSANGPIKDLEKKLEKAFAPHPSELRVGGFGRRRVPAGETGRRVAMTLRLDPDRHLKLRVLSAHAHQSCQQILTQALDDYLGEHCQDHGIKSCRCLQERVGNA